MSGSALLRVLAAGRRLWGPGERRGPAGGSAGRGSWAPGSGRAAGLRGLLAALALSAVARGDSIEECLSASERGQQERNEGYWKRARGSFESCARDVCPKEVRQDCHGWLTEVAARMPSLVFRARDRAGNDLRDVRVWIDDHLEMEQLDGRAIPVDPGPRRLRLERGKARVSVDVVVVETEKVRLVEVTLDDPPAPPASSAPPRPLDGAPARSIPTATLVLGGVGALGVAGFAYLGLRAQGEADAMRGSCAPSCPSARVDEARRDALLANVSLGVGVAALGAAAVLWWAAPAPKNTAQLWLAPGLLGGGWSRRF